MDRALTDQEPAMYCGLPQALPWSKHSLEVGHDGTGERLYINFDLGGGGGQDDPDRQYGLFEVDLTDPDAVQQRLLLNEASGFVFMNFWVNADGDVLGEVFNVQTRGSMDQRWILKAGGGIQQLDEPIGGCRARGPSFDPSSFYFARVGSSPAETGGYLNEAVVERLVKRLDGNFAVESYASASTTSTQMIGSSQAAELSRDGDRIFCGLQGPWAMGSFSWVLEMTNVENAPLLREITGVPQGKVFQSGATLFFASVGEQPFAVGRYRIDTGEGETYFSTFDYAVSAADVAPDGEITFAGVRLSDSVRVLARVPAGSSTPQLLEGGPSEVTIIQRIQ